MYVPQVLLSSRLSTILPSLPLEKSTHLSFDMSGVAGLTGGDHAVSAMVAVHVYRGRRWLGWYNNPGSFQIYDRLSSFANTVSWRNIFGGNHSTRSLSVHTDPIQFFGLDSCKGPKFQAAHSGTTIQETGHVASLVMKECTALESERKTVPGRKTQPVGITIVDLGQAPASEVYPACSDVFTLISASVPIAVSVGACALCAVFGDWYASGLILVGIVASGVSCLVLGSADFVFNHPEPAKGSPAGDGILSSDKDIVILRGTEGAVNTITRGRFSLRFSSECHHHLVRLFSFLFLIQAIAQLLLIAQASLFGQIMFLASLSVSALYNTWISSTDKEKIHRQLLFEGVLDNPTLTKYTLGTRTTAVVFTLLVLNLQEPKELLNELLPNDTKVWKQWKATIMEGLCHPDDQSFRFGNKVRDLDGFTQQENDLLQTLYDDARAAYDGYRDHLCARSL